MASIPNISITAPNSNDETNQTPPTIALAGKTIVTMSNNMKFGAMRSICRIISWFNSMKLIVRDGGKEKFVS